MSIFRRGGGETASLNKSLRTIIEGGYLTVYAHAKMLTTLPAKWLARKKREGLDNGL